MAKTTNRRGKTNKNTKSALEQENEKHASKIAALETEMAEARKALLSARPSAEISDLPHAPFLSNPVENYLSFKHDPRTHYEKPVVNLIDVPTWTRLDFVKERLKFQKHASVNNFSDDYTSGKSDPGFYFYKVFFNFNTGSGLFGSIISTVRDNNNAWQYLRNNIYGDKFSDTYRKILVNKLSNLERFVKLLNFLTMECPWFFKEVSGLDEATKYNFNEIAKAENKKISIKFNQDAVDMRVSTLIDLYKDACFDYTNFKEVIPENLRKFDMSIILFNPPYISGVTANEQTKQSSEMNYTDLLSANSNFYLCEQNKLKNIKNNIQFDDISYKCIILKNCEILYNDLSSVTGTFTNLEPIKAELQMDISFERFYVYTVNYELNTKILDGLFNTTTQLDLDTDETNDSTTNDMIVSKYQAMNDYAKKLNEAATKMREAQVKIDKQNEDHAAQVKKLTAKKQKKK